MGETQSKPQVPARERLMQAAMALFYARGIAGTGIDAIVERAGVAKKSLYNNFSSKADLVAQYVQARHEEWLALYAARRDAAQGAQGPQAGVLAVFDAYHDHAQFAYERGFRGCGLLNAAGELEAGHPGRAAVARHKQQVEDILAGHLGQILPDDPARAAMLAAQIAFILEGAMMRAGLAGDAARILQARAMVQQILAAL
ncbi:MAG: TetR/AcrR family transcriptional regulator [Sulfitobacter sp.]